MFLPIVPQAMTKPVASPTLSCGEESMSRASAGITAAAVAAPFSPLTKRSHSHEGTSPVIAPRTTSPTNPSTIIRFRPNRSEYPPRYGDSTADINMKLDVKRPMDATGAPSEMA